MKPTKVQLGVLALKERVAFRIAAFLNGPLKLIMMVWNCIVSGGVVMLCVARRLRIDGLDKLQAYRGDQSLILVSNHRSYFDFYVIGTLSLWRTWNTKRLVFPVRSTFFYDNPIGTLVNLLVAGMAMYPPIMRKGEKRPFNDFAMDWVTRELNEKSMLVGIHPEGRRSKDSDPYTLMRPRPGVGRLTMGAQNAKVLPIFILGLSNRMGHEAKLNWFGPRGHEIDVVIGDPIDFSDMAELPHTRENHILAAERCMKAVEALGERQREIAAARQAEAAARKVAFS